MFGNRKIRCVIAHDVVLLRQGLRRLLEDEGDIEVVAEAGNAVEAFQSVVLNSPDIVIADAGLFGLAASQVKPLLLQASPRSRVLFLAERDDENQTGAEDSCVPRETTALELVDIVRSICFANGAVDSWEKARAEWVADGSKGALTGREREVLKLLAEGRTVRSTAAILGLSAKTVDAHKFNLMRKLGIHNKAELVMWAIQKRLVKMPEN